MSNGTMVECKVLLCELREARLSAEIDKRWALYRADVKAYRRACAEFDRLTNAIFMAEAAIAAQQKKDDLIPPDPCDPAARGLRAYRH